MAQDAFLRRTTSPFLALSRDMAYLFVGLIVLQGAAVLLASAVLIASSLRPARPESLPDAHTRAAEREKRSYPLS